MDVNVIYPNASDYDQDARGFIPNMKITHRLVNEPCMRPRPKGKSMKFSFSRSWRSNLAYAGILPTDLDCGNSGLMQDLHPPLVSCEYDSNLSLDLSIQQG